MKLTESDLANVLGQAGGSVLITDTDGRIVYANAIFCTTTGYTLDEIRGKSPSILRSEKTSQEVYDDLWATIRKGKVWSGRILNKRKPKLPMRIAGGNPRGEDHEYWAELTITPIRNEAGEVYLYAAVHQDVSEQVEIEAILDFDRIGAQARAKIASILQEPIPLHDRISQSLEILSSLEELHIENKCGIFIANEERTHLDMFAIHGEFSQEFIDHEKQVPFGKCLCGRVAVSGETIISDDCFCDKRHENIFPDMTPHGHYIVPLRLNETTIGVMFIYTQVYPSRNQTRIDMLQNVGHLIAQAIKNDQIEHQVIEASKAAQASSIVKSEFLANMSHEIRTPLNGILGFTDMLLREDERTSEEDRTQWLGVIQSSGKHLLQLINNILDLSKVESGEIDLEMTPCDPMSILADLASVMRIHATDKMIDLTIKSDGRLPKSILTDQTRFRQILTNLVANAVKFTDQGSVTIRPSLQSDGQEGDGQEEMTLVIEIIDTGTGIPPEKLETIFDPFSQADNSITRRFGGTGLGLTISRQLADKLGGSLTVSSTPGVGSTFTMSLPIGKASEIEYQENFQSEALRGTHTRTSEQSTADRLNGHVLLVDDGETNRQLIGVILQRAGAQVTTANNGQEGFDLAMDQAFDLILMDMQMPIMDGYTASTRLRQQGITTPIIALTASAMISDRPRCLDAGCSDYLTKPVDIEELINYAAKWMNQSSAPVANEKHDQQDQHEEHVEDAEHDQSMLISSLPMDDPELRTIVCNYIQTLPEQLREIEQAGAEMDLSRLAKSVHKLIGSGGTVGIDPLTEAAIELEEHLLREDFTQVTRSIAQLGQVIEQAMRGVEHIARIHP